MRLSLGTQHSPTLTLMAQGVGAVFNPQILFTGGEQGYIYDNNDLGSFYSDSAMTTLATVNGPVGAQRDKSPNANHRTQATAASRPTLRGTPTGASFLVNGNFAGGSTGWTTPAGWAIGSGVATATAASSILTSTTAVVIGRTYLVKGEVTAYTSGSLQIRVGGMSAGFNSGIGRFERYVTAVSVVGIEIVGTTLTASVDNLELFDVTSGVVTAPYGLQYDGLDDFLQTASVNFTATNKMTVCAGIRKLSDAVGDVYFLALSSALSSLGSFAIRAPRTSATAHYGFTYNASTAAGYDASSFSAPITNVLSMQMDGAGASQAQKLMPRVNGLTPTLTLVGVTSGTGNFGNYPFYFGRLGGTTGPFNGLDFGGICINRTLSAADLTSTERWVGVRTGVTI